VPIIRPDKALLSCDYRIKFSSIISIIINDIADWLSHPILGFQ